MCCYNYSLLLASLFISTSHAFLWSPLGVSQWATLWKLHALDGSTWQVLSCNHVRNLPRLVHGVPSCVCRACAAYPTLSNGPLLTCHLGYYIGDVCLYWYLMASALATISVIRRAHAPPFLCLLWPLGYTNLRVSAVYGLSEMGWTCVPARCYVAR